MSFREISDLARIHPSYFSRAVAEKASFSQQQIFRVGEVVDLNRDEIDYFILLWQVSEAQSKSEKNYFKAKLSQFQEKKLNLSHRLKDKIVNEESTTVDIQDKISEYYKETITSQVHMLLTLAAYRSDSLRISEKLKITPEKLEYELKKLEKLSLIKRSASGKILDLQFSLHLDEKSSLSTQNHINWRLKAIQNLESREPRDCDYHLSVCYAASEETQFQIKKLLRETVLQIRGLVQSDENSSDIFKIMMDLF